MNKFHDVIVIGAGPGGSTTASLLAQRGLDVLLLDKSEFPRDKTCGDALSPRAIKVAAGLGLEGELHNLGFRVDILSATGPSGERVDIPIPQHEEYPDHGLVIRRIQLDDLIRQAALTSGVHFQAGAKATDIKELPGCVSVQVETQRENYDVRSQVAVIAVGANLSLLRKLDLLPDRIDLSVAARRYYQNLPRLDHTIHIRFDGIPLPGYGWIFPLSEHEANIGAGFTLGSQSSPASAPAALDAFLSHPPIHHQLASAKAIGSTRGFPLRTDFHRAPTHRGRMVLVGEATGLVNPFTGEGIDYALESAELAAASLTDGLNSYGSLRPHLEIYDRSLRQRFQETFVLTHLLRRIYMRPLLLDPLIRACRHWPQLGHQLIRVMLAYESPRSILSGGTFLKLLWAGLRPATF